ASDTAEQDLLAHDLRTVEFEPGEVPAREAAHERVTPPPRESIPGVERQAGQCDRRHPYVDGLLQPFPVRPGMDGRAAPVVHAEADEGPAVVGPGAHDVQLVATLRTMLVGPQLPARMERQPPRVPLSV